MGAWEGGVGRRGMEEGKGAGNDGKGTREEMRGSWDGDRKESWWLFGKEGRPRGVPTHEICQEQVHVEK